MVGMLSNFPLELFISDLPMVTQLMGPKQDNAVLGLLIDESMLVAASERGLLVNINIKPMELNTVQRCMRLIDTATTAHDKMVIEAFSQLVARLPAGGYGTTEFDMSDERRDALVDSGRRAMRAYFDHPPVPPHPTRGVADAETEQAQATANRLAKRLLV